MVIQQSTTSDDTNINTKTNNSDSNINNNNTIDDDLVNKMMKNTPNSSAPTSSECCATVVLSSLSTTENSKIHIHDNHDDNKNNNNHCDNTAALLSRRHEQAMEILHQLWREGKLSKVMMMDDHHQDGKNVKSLAQFAEEKHNGGVCVLSPSLLLLVIFKTVCLLDLLHKHHLVHRNLNMENILVEQWEDANLMSVHLGGLDTSVELFLMDSVSSSAGITTSTMLDEHAGKSIPHKLFTFNRHAQTTHGYQPPETEFPTPQPFICFKSEIWSLAVSILRVLFKKSIIVHPENYVEQLDELFGKEDEDLASQDENQAIMICLKEMTRNMLRPDVNERWSCSDVMEYICVASTFLTSITKESLNQ